MVTFVSIKNETLSLGQITSVITLLSFLSAQFYTRSISTLINLEASSFINLQKFASKHFLEINQNFEGKQFKAKENEGFLVVDENIDFVKLIKAKPKFIVVVNFTKEKNLAVPEYLLNMVTPPSTSIFIAHVSEVCNTSQSSTCYLSGTCSRVYKPAPSFSSAMFPMLVYKNNTDGSMFWNWENSTNWLSFKKNIRNMTGITVSVAIASHRDEQTAIEIFLKGKNSFYWRMLAEHLNFKMKILCENVAPELVKSITRVYVKLLMTSADGLGVLPVMTSGRTQFLEYVVTGLDSKYQLMVRSPQFVHSWQYIFKPFTYESWICLGLTAFFISITLCVITYKQKEKYMEFSNCFLTIFGFVCGQGSANIPKSFAARLVCYTGLIFSFSIFQFYTSNFYSLLSTKVVAFPFTSLEQFLAKQTHSLYVHPDTAIYAQILAAKAGTFKRLWEEVLQKDPMHQLKTNTRGKALSKVCKGKGAILGLPFQTTSMKELSCKLVAVNSGFFPTNVVIVIKKGFAFKSQFKFVLLRLLEGGLSHKFKEEFIDMKTEKQTKNNINNEAVTLEQVSFLFAFYAVFIVFSVLVLCVEIIGSKTFLIPREFRKKENFFQNTT